MTRFTPSDYLARAETADPETAALPDLFVTRYSKWLSDFRPWSGDYLRVGNTDLGEFQDIVEAEYQRAKADHPANPAFHMRPMFYTGSPFGAEILALARECRAALTGDPT